MYFCYFVIISPWKIGGPSFEQTWIPSPKDALCPVYSLSGRTDRQTDRRYIFNINNYVITALHQLQSRGSIKAWNKRQIHIIHCKCQCYKKEFHIVLQTIFDSILNSIAIYFTLFLRNSDVIIEAFSSIITIRFF